MSRLQEQTVANVEADADLPPFLKQLLESVAGKQLVKKAAEAAENWIFSVFERNRTKTVFRKKIKVLGVTVGTATIKMHDVEDAVRDLLAKEHVEERDIPIV